MIVNCSGMQMKLTIKIVMTLMVVVNTSKSFIFAEFIFFLLLSSYTYKCTKRILTEGPHNIVFN